MTQRLWYVYALCDPDTKEPFYIGKLFVEIPLTAVLQR